jgi:hypothetical protein
MKYLKLIVILILLLTTVSSQAQVGIGTTTPNASAKLDVTSTNKGFLPPRVTLTGTADVATIASPATGLMVYNTATAGTSPNNVIPGYYYWNGAAWTRISNNSNSTILASSTVTVSATITAPTTGTRTIDRTFAVDNGITKKITVQLGYDGGNAGSGDYLFSLPLGITFNTSAGYNPIFTGTLWSPSISAFCPYIIPISGVVTIGGAWNQYMFVVPFSSTQYRVGIGLGNAISFWNSGWFAASTNTLFSGTFDIR